MRIMHIIQLGVDQREKEVTIPANPEEIRFGVQGWMPCLFVLAELEGQTEKRTVIRRGAGEVPDEWKFIGTLFLQKEGNTEFVFLK